MEEFLTYEYVVEHSKKDKKLIRKKVLLIILYVSYCIIGFPLAAFSNIGPLIAALLAFIPISCWLMVFLTWRYVSIEYCYSMTSGILTHTTIYGGKTKKRLFEMRLSDAECIQPYTAEKESDIKKYAPEKRYYCFSDPASPDAYYMLFRDINGKRCLYCFEATQKALRVMHFYNKKTVITSVRY